MLKTPVAKSRRARKKEETREKIIAVAMASFRQHGYAATTMEQIAAEADIAKGTLYNYFPAKEAIVSEYIRRSFRAKNQLRLAQLRQQPDSRARLIHLFSELLTGVQLQKELFAPYLLYRMQKLVSLQPEERDKSGLHRLALAVIALGQEEGDIRSDIPRAMLEELFEFAFIEAVKQFYAAGDRFDLQTTVATCVDLFLHGATAKEAGADMPFTQLSLFD
jgi:AcrR family transcriptional regulator